MDPKVLEYAQQHLPEQNQLNYLMVKSETGPPFKLP